ncbi:MAG: hypothetical protein AABW54_03155 [Candidatus Micrarchaeota archaeon]
MNKLQYSRKDIDAALQAAGKALSKPVDAYLIGGCAMTFRNLKPSTKDADLLFEEELEEQRFFTALREAGFRELFPGSYDVPLKAKDILINDSGLQFDLFAKQVMGGLRLTAAMKKRAEKHAEYGKLAVFLAAKEDVYLFKAITDRPFPRDYEDLLTLQQSGLDWNAITAEYEAQIKGRPIEANLVKKLAKLKEQGITTPLMKRLS